MIGEFEFGGIFLEEESKANSDQVFYDGTTYLVFIIFLILVTIIIMNLLVSNRLPYNQLFNDVACLYTTVKPLLSGPPEERTPLL